MIQILTRVKIYTFLTFSKAPKFKFQILETVNIKNLATSNCVKDWGKVPPSRARVGKPLAGLGQRMLN